MEKRLNQKLDGYILAFKENIKDKTSQLGLNKDDRINSLIQYIYDYDKLLFTKEDLQKRKRIKNFVPVCDRCSANRASTEQCTRRKKHDSEYCGTHMKGTPHGIVNNINEIKPTTHKIEVFAKDIHGIIYYLDNLNNVYQMEDIINGKQNPKIIAKYEIINDIYCIPELGI
jgi:hypothetical protein